MRILYTIVCLISLYSFARTQTPVNDICADAILLELSTDCVFTFPYNNSGATGIDPDVGFDPVCISQTADHDVWFYFEVPPSGRVLIDFNDYNFDIKAEVYSGDCSNLEIIQNEFGNCAFRESFEFGTLNLNQTPGEILYVRVFGGEGDYYICGLEYGPVSSCENPIELNVSSTCDLVYHYSTSTNWYAIDMPANVPFVNIDAYGAAYFGPYENTISVYKNTCGNLELIAKTGNTTVNGFFERNSAIRIENNGSPNQRYLISVSSYDYFLGVIGVCAQYKENDFCSGATQIGVGTSCDKIPISSFGSSESLNPRQSPSCGYYVNDIDVWAYAVVPQSGNLTFDVTLENAPPGRAFENAVEYYTGDCEDLEILYCDRTEFRISSFGSPLHTVPFTGLVPGSIVYVRLFLSALPEGFTICAYEEASYNNYCRVNAIVFDEIGECDPNTNRFLQPFEVHYSLTGGTNSFLRIDGNSFALSGNSPETFTLSLDPDGDNFNHQITRITGDCNSPSEYHYLHFDAFNIPETCPIPQTNDVCDYAIEIDPLLECTVGTEFFPNDPTVSSYLPKLSDHKDVWFKFIVTSQLQYIDFFYEYSVNSSARPLLEIYRGNCDQLELLPNPTSSIGNLNEPIELSHLDIGETIYIRLAFEFASNNNSFSFCAEPLCDHELYITDTLSMDSLYQANYLISSNSVIGNNNPHIIFQSNNIIELQDGFEVQKNRVFEAIIEHCN